MKISSLKGIGDKSAELFHKIGIYEVEDLVSYYPINYDTYNNPELISSINEEGIYAIYAMIVSTPLVKATSRIKIITTTIKDSNADCLKVTWFNMPFLKNALKPGMRFVLRGRVSKKNNFWCMEQPTIYKYEDYAIMLNSMQPVYGLTKALTNNMVKKAIKQALTKLDIIDYIPKTITNEYNLMDYKQAIEDIHFPENKDMLINARSRIAFNEIFIFLLSLAKLKESFSAAKNNFNITKNIIIDSIIDKLPYKLTNAQLRTLMEVFTDLESDKVMNRLIQGDVGSGKTIIAFLATISTCLCGYQAAIMAPTEVLASQHYANLMDLINKNGLSDAIKPVLLTGSLAASKKKTIYEAIKNNEFNIIIGTHAIFQDKVEYNNLALVVTDEQHRFGVFQREIFANKGCNPNVLIMSATPIPRTLALIVYGDLDVSIIDELPANRLPIKNCVVGQDYRSNAYKFISEQIDKGHQCYIICALVEESEALEAEDVISYSEELKTKLSSNARITYLHGRMKPDEKNKIMQDFSENKINVLVSTTVIEVGINVPNATVMMIENAERFGLSTLHQLRGRVGRGNDQSFCIFITGKNDDKTKNRLEILSKTNDGFEVANEDLKNRGPGDFFGYKQSGELSFRMFDVINDSKMLIDVKSIIERINNTSLSNSIDLTDNEWRLINEQIEHTTKYVL